MAYLELADRIIASYSLLQLSGSASRTSLLPRQARWCPDTEKELGNWGDPMTSNMMEFSYGNVPVPLGSYFCSLEALLTASSKPMPNNSSRGGIAGKR
jgi:hypothetical protein